MFTKGIWSTIALRRYLPTRCDPVVRKCLVDSNLTFTAMLKSSQNELSKPMAKNVN